MRALLDAGNGPHDRSRHHRGAQVPPTIAIPRRLARVHVQSPASGVRALRCAASRARGRQSAEVSRFRRGARAARRERRRRAPPRSARAPGARRRLVLRTVRSQVVSANTSDNKGARRMAKKKATKKKAATKKRAAKKAAPKKKGATRKG